MTRGNTNTTTRFRRYIGDPQLRPLLPEHDLASAQALLQPNVTQKIQLVANRERIQYYHESNLIFDFQDRAPYTRGHFALRTTFSRIQVCDFRVYRLQ